VLCWALPEAMTDRLMQEVAGQIGMSTGAGTLSAEKRKELAQQCTDMMAVLELREESGRGFARKRR
jgi:hypothetical protein